MCSSDLADEAAPDRIQAALTALGSYRTEVWFECVHLLEEGPGRVWTVAADAAFRQPAVVGRGGLPLELTVGERADPLVARWAASVWSAHDRHEYGHGWVPDVPFAVTARREGGVVGLADGVVRGEACELRRLVVDQEVRSQGVGSHLLAAVESLAADRDCTVCRLRAPAGGRAAAFYRTRGWVEVGTLPDWRWGHDFVRMERRLDWAGH